MLMSSVPSRQGLFMAEVRTLCVPALHESDAVAVNWTCTYVFTASSWVLPPLVMRTTPSFTSIDQSEPSSPLFSESALETMLGEEIVTHAGSAIPVDSTFILPVRVTRAWSVVGTPTTRVEAPMKVVL